MSRRPTPPPTTPRELTRRGIRLRWFALAVALVTFAAYLPSLSHPFVVWDDEANFVNNPNYRGLGLEQLKWMFTTFHLGPYQPLSWMTLGLDYLVWGMDPRGYHFTNVVLHAVAAALVFALGVTLSEVRTGVGSRQARLLGIAVAFAWALHPLRVEAVSWVTERREVLSGALVFATLLAQARGWRWWWVALFALLAMLAKGTAVFVAPLLVGIDLYRSAEVGRGALWSTAKKSVVRHALVFVFALVLGLIAIRGQGSVNAMVPWEVLGLFERLRIFGNSIGFYVEKTVWPTAIAPMYDPPADRSVLNWPAALSVSGLLGFLVVTWRARSRIGHLWLVVPAYLVLLLPIGGLAQVGSQLVADRYAYQPGLIVVLGLVASVAFLVPRPTFTARAVMVAIVSAALGWRCIEQQAVWSSSAALWRHELKHYPDSPIAHLHMGLLQVEGKLPESTTAEAEAHFRAAIARSPGFGDAWCALGDLYGRAGDSAGALAAYEAAIAAQPHNRPGLLACANLRYALGKSESALMALRKLCEAAPNEHQPRLLLGRMLAACGRTREAIAEYERSVTLGPRVARPALELAWLLATNPDDSVRDGARALRLVEGVVRAFGPSDPDVVQARAAALAEVGRFDEAVSILEGARSRAPLEARQPIDALIAQYRARQPMRAPAGYP